MVRSRSLRWIASFTVVVLLLPACGDSDDDVAAATADPTPPDEVAALIDEWYDAASRGDGSVLDLYTSTGYHLYGAKSFTGEDLVIHLETPGISHEWVSELMLVVDEGDGRYVVTRGMRNSGAVSGVSAMTFEILAQSDGELRIAQSAWSKITW
jgi:hypothetical protein